MPALPLIHPIYLDVPMLVSFAAATQGGLALSTEVTTETEKGSTRDAKIAGKLSVSKLLSTFLNASIDSELASKASDSTHAKTTEARAHTEASIAILLYDVLTKNDEYLKKPKSLAEFSEIGPGTLVEVAGTLHKNAVDSLFDAADAMSIFMKFADSDDQVEQALSSTRPKGKQRNQNRGNTQKDAHDPLKMIKEALTQDRERTPISNAVLECIEPAGITAVVTLRTDNLRDLTLSELNKNTVRVVGKVTRQISEGETMSAFENYAFSLLKPDFLRSAFSNLDSADELQFSLPDVEIKGPAVQVLPLMVFV